MIPITKPFFDNKEVQAVAKVLKSGWVTSGPKVQEFEESVKKYTHAPFTIATSSATTGLHLALAALGISPADEVIVPALTWVATANVCLYLWAKPVFVDIDLATFNIDPAQIESKITKSASRQTKAIIPVHLFGLAANMAEIMKIAKKHHLAVIEDAACALGTKYLNKHVGLWGDVGVISFHPRKSITTGEGGMVLTKSKKLSDKIASLRNHGGPEFNDLGYNYRLTDIQAAVGTEQMKKFPKILSRRLKLAKVYNQAFKNHPFLSVPITPDYSNHTYQSYVLLVKKTSPLTRDELAKKLFEKGIQTRPVTQNVPMLGYYRKMFKFKPQDFPAAHEAEQSSLAIPLYHSLKPQEQKFIIDNILKILDGKN
jgi:dTDP-4-amino-4,6-dideoxygalactose transaminase